jgi:hypothetical protein
MDILGLCIYVWDKGLQISLIFACSYVLRLGIYQL